MSAYDIIDCGPQLATGALLGLSDRDCELKWLFAKHGHRREGLASALVGKLLPFMVIDL